MLQHKVKLLAVLVEVLGSPLTGVTFDDWLQQQVKLYALHFFLFAAPDSYFSSAAAPQVGARYLRFVPEVFFGDCLFKIRDVRACMMWTKHVGVIMDVDAKVNVNVNVDFALMSHLHGSSHVFP